MLSKYEKALFLDEAVKDTDGIDAHGVVLENAPSQILRASKHRALFATSTKELDASF